MRRLLVLMYLAGPLFAQQMTLSIMNQGQVRPGNTLQLQARLAGASAASMASFQFNVQASIPGTWSVTNGDVALGAGKTFTCAPPDATSPDFRCIVSGMNSNTISDGSVAVLSLDIPSNAPTGQVTITTSNTLGASGTGGAVPLTTSSVNFTLASPLSPCDLNSDGTTNVQDVQSAINQWLGLAARSLDLDSDGKTTVVDVQRVINAAVTGTCKVGQ